MKDTMTLCEHYQNYFYTVKANTPDLLEQAYHVRYQVYCKELKKLSPNSENEFQESDEWDDDAVHGLLFYKRDKKPIGNIRIITLEGGSEKKLPIELYYKKEFDFRDSGITSLKEGKAGEVSRMALISRFRRRPSDKDHSLNNYMRENDHENRRFSTNYLPMCLTFSSISLMLEHALDYGIALMEPRLARLLVRFGVELKQIGQPVDHFGIRAPFLIFPNKTYQNLMPEYRLLFDIISSELKAFH
ncbi:MAG: PEP-CTERM/exosortase system-associated acyltransferase [Methylomicrobium sp.]|nr:PEP-CTERM/exosortase system-associated acyltransferase [Methylomicrobium sp.]